MRQSVDLEAYLRQRVTLRNEHGRRGYAIGVRTFDCPFCGDHRGRGWMNVQRWTAGCFNAGCVADPRISGGAIEWIRRAEGRGSRPEVWQMLRQAFGIDKPVVYDVLVERGPDFVRFPAGSREFDVIARPIQISFNRFIKRQWNITVTDARHWDLRYCVHGDYAWRIVIPIRMDHKAVGFQARTIREAEPKYLTSKHGSESDPESECARPAGAMLFNYDSIVPESDVMLVEGCGDVMGWHRGQPGRQPTAIGLLGQELTPERLALLALKRPDRVIVALDAEPEAQRRAQEHIEDLMCWGLNACLGRWRGGKDAGSGADVEVIEPDTSLLGDIRTRLGLLSITSEK